MSATATETESARHWTLAVLVVVSGMTLGASVGAELNHPLIGAIAGIGAALVTNYTRGCPPCRRHAAQMRATIMASTVLSETPAEDCIPCARARARALARIAEHQTTG